MTDALPQPPGLPTFMCAPMADHGPEEWPTLGSRYRLQCARCTLNYYRKGDMSVDAIMPAVIVYNGESLCSSHVDVVMRHVMPESNWPRNYCTAILGVQTTVVGGRVVGLDPDVPRLCVLRQQHECLLSDGHYPGTVHRCACGKEWP